MSSEPETGTGSCHSCYCHCCGIVRYEISFAHRIALYIVRNILYSVYYEYILLLYYLIIYVI